MKKLAVFLLAAVALGFGLLELVPGSLGPPSDAAMIRNLERHRAVFEHLIAMIREDKGLERVDDDWTRPDDPATIGVSAARIAEYRRLFAEAGISRGFYSFNDATTITFMAYASGLSISGCSKSYIFTGKPPEELVDEPLDAFHAASKILVRRRIEGDWYLEYEAS
jgi:hypothetical protein